MDDFAIDLDKVLNDFEEREGNLFLISFQECYLTFMY